MSIEVLKGSSDSHVTDGLSVEARLVEHEALCNNIRAFESREDWLKDHHNAKWVVFHDAAFFDAFDTFDTAARKAIEQFGTGPYLIRQVGQPAWMRMPSSVAYRPAHATG